VTGRVFIVAEAGVNHNGSLDLALRLVDAAADAGADAVKFQAFTSSALAVPDAPTAAYQEAATGEVSQAEMLAALELDEGAHRALAARCGERGITFMSSAFDLESLAMLARLGVDILKIPSGEITDLPYLRAVAALGKRVFLSTGMADLDEVRAALLALEAAGLSRDRVTVLQCTTEYPTPSQDANLRAMVTMREELGMAVGFSDHTAGPEAALAAAALGASVIEKHLTLDRSMPGPDHFASIEPGELADLVGAIRTVEAELGDGVKRPSAGELDNARVVRKSIVVARPVAAGERFSVDNLTVKRPATGISPMRWDEVVGRPAKRDFAADELVEL
jgi:N,N'-diacetyllegionaminate synthase